MKRRCRITPVYLSWALYLGGLAILLTRRDYLRQAAQSGRFAAKS